MNLLASEVAPYGEEAEQQLKDQWKEIFEMLLLTGKAMFKESQA